MEKNRNFRLLHFKPISRYNSTFCSLIVQKQESREMPQTNLTGLIRIILIGRYAELFFFVETVHVLKKTTINR